MHRTMPPPDPGSELCGVLSLSGGLLSSWSPILDGRTDGTGVLYVVIRCGSGKGFICPEAPARTTRHQHSASRPRAPAARAARLSVAARLISDPASARRPCGHRAEDG